MTAAPSTYGSSVISAFDRDAVAFRHHSATEVQERGDSREIEAIAIRLMILPPLLHARAECLC